MIKIQKRIWILLIVLLSLIPIVTAPIWYGTSTSSEDNLVGHWACEGNFDDSSDEGNDGTQSGGVSIGTGYKGRGCEFDGVNDYITVPSSSDFNLNNTNTFTVSFWTYVDNFPTCCPRIVVLYGDADILYFSVHSSNKMRFFGSGFTSDIYGTSTVLGKWVHAVGVYNGTDMLMYVNGVQEGNSSITGLTSENKSIELGVYSPTANYYLNGSLDEVRVYNTSLSAEEISSLYNSSKSYYLKIKSSPTEGLVDESQLKLHWSFDAKDGSTSATAPDISGSGYDGAVTSAIFTNEGRFKEGYKFDGTNDRIDTSAFNLGNTSGITVAGWYKSPSALMSTTCTILYKANTIFELAPTSTDKIQIWMTNNQSWHQNGLSPAYTDWDSWHHYVGTYNGSMAIIYRDGVQVVNSSIGSGDIPSSNAAARTGYGSGGAYCNGTLDEVRLYNRSLSAAEVADLYNGTKSNKIVFKSMPSQGIKNETPAPTISDETGLVGHWKMNTNALDSSGEGNDGIITRASNATGRWGGAYEFDGSNQYIDLGDIDAVEGLNETTYSVWVKPKNFNDAVYDYFLIKNSQFILRIRTAGTLIDYIFWNSTGTAHSTVGCSLTQDKWTHLAVTYNRAAENISLYCDGSYYNSKAMSGATQNNANPLYASYTASGFNGSIDEIRIYNRTLSAAEVQELYQSKGLVGHWSFDAKDGSNSNIAPDISGYNNSGTVTSATFTNEGRFKEGYKFDGLNDYIEVGNDTSLRPLSSLSLSAWIYPKEDKSVQFIAGYGNTGFYGYWLGWESGNRIQGSVGNGTVVERVYSAQSINSWHHAVLIYNGTAAQLYINGVLEDTQSNINGDIDYTGLSSFKIGQIHGMSATRYWNGSIDEVKIFNRALTSTEIGNLYNGTKSSHLRFYSVAG